MSYKLNINCLKFSLVALFMLILQLSFAQKKVAATDKNTIAYNKLFDDKKSLLGKDFSVAIATPDSIVYQTTIGDPANAKMPFPIGASSQWLTTALVMQLVDEGKLSLDEPVKTYLPIFESYRRNYITIRHCLTHKTGLTKEGFKASALLDKKISGTLEEAVADLLKKDVHANAGEEFRYNNNGMIILARVIEVITKKRFDQIIRTRLFVPLGMRGTSFSTDNGTTGHPANGAKSTVADFTKFLQMLLNNGKAGAKQVLSEAAVEEMRKIQIATPSNLSIPKAVEGMSLALGAWATGSTMATTLVMPGYDGTWPMVDFAKGYAFLVFSRDFSGEQKPTVYMELKNSIDQYIPTKK